MEHAEMVYRGAQETLQFLESEFDNRNSHLKALTSKGSVLDTITYRVEETTDEVCVNFVMVIITSLSISECFIYYHNVNNHRKFYILKHPIASNL